MFLEQKDTSANSWFNNLYWQWKVLQVDDELPINWQGCEHLCFQPEKGLTKNVKAIL